jgi:uncharacterized SAM-binding protein YcdF (DUF218 family)
MFILSKMIDLLLNPLNFLFLWGVVCTILLYGKLRSWGHGLLSAGIISGLLLMIFPLDEKLVLLLEDRFPKPAVSHVDGIVVLGGAINVPMSVARGRPSINEAAERVTEMVMLMHSYPDAKIIFSGGSGNPFDQSVKEADILKKMLFEMGEDADRVLYEDQSRNTYENAVYSKRLASPADGQVWLLVTSAIHMPRAMGCFAAVHWAMTPWPVNYTSQGQGYDDLTSHIFTPHRLQSLSNALHEGFGLVYYHLRGWTNAWFPSP